MDAVGDFWTKYAYDFDADSLIDSFIASPMNQQNIYFLLNAGAIHDVFEQQTATMSDP